MKKLFLFFQLFYISLHLNGQSPKTFVVFNCNAGYSFNAAAPTLSFEVGVRTGNVFLSIGGIAQVTRTSYEPILIAPIKTGYDFGKLQLFGTTSYQTIGAENEQFFKGTSHAFRNGFYVGGGFTYYCFDHVSVTAQLLGREVNYSIGCYTNF